ncbi:MULTISPECIES: hypothetical protein [unclassified Streptomyces]|uniref:hypothetical protein n=1 Tax=unclassified Streptomyces TaxID=2593676 RepID=UPI0040433883
MARFLEEPKFLVVDHRDDAAGDVARELGPRGLARSAEPMPFLGVQTEQPGRLLPREAFLLGQFDVEEHEAVPASRRRASASEGDGSPDCRALPGAALV